MDKRLIAGALLAISIALVGLVVIQGVWIRKTIALKEEQFTHGVDNALFTVSERLERMERMREVQRHRSGRRLLARIDRIRAEQMEMEALRAAAEAGDDGMDMHAPTDTDFAVSPDPPIPPEPMMEATAAPEIDPEEYEELVTDMVRGILTSELARDVRDRIDPQLLESLLNAELAAAGVGEGFNYGVFTPTGAWVDLAEEHAGDTAALARSPFRERLFRHDVAGHAYYLNVLLPEENASFAAGLWPMLVASGFFILIIALAFVFTIRTLLRQKRLNDIRNDLVNNLTHELKTPISTISLACEALADPSMPKTEQQVRTYTTMIRDENKRLGSLVENVLQSAVQDSGRMVLKPVDLDLHAVIHDVVRSSTIRVSRRNGRIDLELAAEIHGLKGDRIHLTNLLYNLIDNAVKYTEKEPRIRIGTTSDDEGITVHITDNGIGIPASEHRKIFDKLYRVPTGNLHNAKGFGLGLSYVKSVVDRHGGRIKLESTPGQGTTFHIFLPYEHVQAHQAVGR